MGPTQFARETFSAAIAAPGAGIEVGQTNDAWSLSLKNALAACRQLDSDHPLATILDATYHLTAGEVPDINWHLRVFRLDQHESCFAIVGSSALRDAIYTFSKALFLSNFLVQTKDYDGLTQVNRLVRAQVGFLRSGHGWSRSANLRLPSEWFGLASEATVIAEAYLMLHELAHIGAGDVSSLVDGGEPQDRNHVRGLGTEDVEHLADFTALHGLLNNEESKWTLEGRLLGVELAIATQAILEDATWWRRPSGHPTGKKRLSAFDWALANLKVGDLTDGMRKARSLTIRPRAFVNLFTGHEWLGVFSESLSASMARRPDLFDSISKEEAVHYDAMDAHDRYLRAPLPLLYRDMVDGSNVTEDQKLRVLQLAPRPDFNRATDTGLEEEYSMIDSRQKDLWWADMVIGQTLLFFDLFPRLESAGLSAGTLRYSELTGLIGDAIGRAAVPAALALLCQVRSGSEHSTIPISMDEHVQIMSTLGLQSS